MPSSSSALKLGLMLSVACSSEQRAEERAEDAEGDAFDPHRVSVRQIS
jgi:hypothetical protein